MLMTEPQANDRGSGPWRRRRLSPLGVSMEPRWPMDHVHRWRSSLQPGSGASGSTTARRPSESRSQSGSDRVPGQNGRVAGPAACSSQFSRDSRLYRFNAGLQGWNRSQRPRRLKPTPDLPRMERRATWRSAPVGSGHVAVEVAAADGSDARQLTHNRDDEPGAPHRGPRRPMDRVRQCGTCR